MARLLSWPAGLLAAVFTTHPKSLLFSPRGLLAVLACSRACRPLYHTPKEMERFGLDACILFTKHPKRRKDLAQKLEMPLTIGFFSFLLLVSLVLITNDHTISRTSIPNGSLTITSFGFSRPAEDTRCRIMEYENTKCVVCDVRPWFVGSHCGGTHLRQF